tara:strand:+ start:161 stop:400 length:240 start_codon:yes stop_codon:yes gene_type:complete
MKRTAPEHVKADLWDAAPDILEGIIKMGLWQPDPGDEDAWGLAREYVASRLVQAWEERILPDITYFVPTSDRSPSPSYK